MKIEFENWTINDNTAINAKRWVEVWGMNYVSNVYVSKLTGSFQCFVFWVLQFASESQNIGMVQTYRVTQKSKPSISKPANKARFLSQI